MPTALPAMRGQFGSTEFFLITMPAKELADRLVIPKEMPEWEDLSLEERFQRDVNFNRVKSHIAPYLANDPDRFFGAFIVSVMQHDGLNFEPIGQIVKNLPQLYQQAARQFGFLYFQGNEVLVPIDGQHRLAAIKFAISGKDEKQKDIPDLTPNMAVASDACTVILIRHDPKRSRKIFNKVNRYAKTTSKADNIITSEDDIVAIISREVVAGDVLGERLVNFESNTLSAKSPEFTTLSTVYDSTKAILNPVSGGKINDQVLPDQAHVKLFTNHAKGFWDTLVTKIDLFRRAVQDAGESGDSHRIELRRDFCIGKPAIQAALILAILRLQVPDSDGSALSLEDICKRVNQVDWTVSNPMWQHVLMNGDKVVTGKQAVSFAARFIAYYLGESLAKKEKDLLKEHYQDHFPASERSKKTLPKAMFS
jgi:DNA sulfur modification protein DndB